MIDIDTILDPLATQATDQQAAADVCDRAIEIIDAKISKMIAGSMPPKDSKLSTSDRSMIRARQAKNASAKPVANRTGYERSILEIHTAAETRSAAAAA